MKLLLPDTVSLSLQLPAGWDAVVVDSAEEIPRQHWDADALATWGPSARHLDSAAENLRALQLVQSLSSGVEAILRRGFRPETVIANGAGLHNRTVAEHTLALLLALVRRLPTALEHQQRHDWSRELGGIQKLHPGDRVTTLLDARILIWGFGSIAQTLAPILTALGATVTGVARHPGERAGFGVVEAGRLQDELPATDVLISVLPATESTRGVVGADVFDALPTRALFVSVGRGDVVDQSALISALRTGAISGAALDVTTPEPLPTTDPLWDAPNLIITPHAAGGRPVGAERLIERNLRALGGDGTIQNRIDRSAS
ncbi:phosphoglycerate dehydrogenase [Microbacterium sp. SYP-A9085]|uniref:NAD(P)-dependent oxidoreductase n=1 Tax=Microbacterium sp. SYP-A9085 TaxID=2664454 RepID=UPI00129B8196|nr:NAD(P)-dependent oxidoreductase [Microbacterium sp. SYP-A9085]MRH28439.1 phosphoglycerate dehydrogenase [Microbacterium sp. SYP-A9085]